MGFNKQQGEQLYADELNSFYSAAGLYGASSAGSDAYAITVTPEPNAYTVGDSYTFKADVANTGPATLNVNGLGAKPIVKLYNNALIAGDILAGQIVRVVYDANGNFQMQSQVSNLIDYKSGIATRDLSTASGAQTIAHGLGVTPRRIRISVKAQSTNNSLGLNASSEGTYDGTSMRCIYLTSTVGNSGGESGNSTSFITKIIGSSNWPTFYNTATVSFDDTNITLNWTRTGSPTGIAHILWEAFA